MLGKKVTAHILPHRGFWAWYERYERVISPVAFFVGFSIDNLTLLRIDQSVDIFILLAWLAVAGLGIAVLNLSRHGMAKWSFLKHSDSWLPSVIQFAFGALFSGFTIFYMRSASLSTSWPFLALVLFLFIGNEFFQKHYLRLTFQVSIFFIALFFLMIFYVPILRGEMGAGTFLLSGLGSLMIVFVFVLLLFAFLPVEARKNKTALGKSIAGIFISVNILYFTNIIPPIPLSLKDAGAYHTMEKSSAGKDVQYILRGESRHWYDFFRPHQEIHILYGEPVYFYSAVFAPTKLSTGIAHDWQYYDTAAAGWVSAGKFPFDISGGRDQGYRGYSIKTNIQPGLWRVDVVTDRGQVIGRTKFMVIETQTPAALETVVR